jgi:K+:H+ antiporter subunit KhtT
MTLDLRETRLPGVGVKFVFKTVHGVRVTVVQHLSGEREIYVQRPREEEPSVVLELNDEEARQLAVVLGGTYERPKIVDDLELALGDLQIEWVPVPDGSWAIGRTLAECAFRRRTGATVIAMLREPVPVSGAQPDDVVEKGDTLVVVGKVSQVSAFRKLLQGSDPDATP